MLLSDVMSFNVFHRAREVFVFSFGAFRLGLAEKQNNTSRSHKGVPRMNIHSLDGTQNRLLDPQLRKGATFWIDGAEVSDVLRLKAQDRPQLQAE